MSMPLSCETLPDDDREARAAQSQQEQGQVSFSDNISMLRLPCLLAIFFSFLSFPFLSFPSLPFPSLPFPSLSFPSLPFPSLSFPFLSFPSLSFPFLPFPSLSCPFLSFPSCLTKTARLRQIKAAGTRPCEPPKARDQGHATCMSCHSRHAFHLHSHSCSSSSHVIAIRALPSSI
jgi:hypothetical protein